MKQLLILGAVYLAGSLVLKADTSGKPPNIVLIFADDLGWKDVGYQSEGKFLTPTACDRSS